MIKIRERVSSLEGAAEIFRTELRVSWAVRARAYVCVCVCVCGWTERGLSVCSFPVLPDALAASAFWKLASENAGCIRGGGDQSHRG